MSLLSRRRGARPVAHLPQDLARSLPRGCAVLGAVPLRPDGECWLVAAPHALLRLGHSDGEAGALPASTGWDRISRASWDAERRTLTLHLLHDAHGPRVLSVPDAVRRPPDPRGAGASVRRGADGVLYSTTEPDSSRERTDGLGRELRDLERRAREAVGLPTL